MPHAGTGRTARAGADRIPALQAVAPGVEFIPVDRRSQDLPPADASIRVCTPAAFAASPDLRWLQMLSHGIDACLRVPAVRERQLTMTATKGAVTAAVADHAMSLVLAHARALDFYAARQSRREWVDDPSESQRAGTMQAERELRGSTLLVYGLGGIGTEIAKRAHAFDMRVIGIRASGRSGPDYVGAGGSRSRTCAATSRANRCSASSTRRRVTDRPSNGAGARDPALPRTRRSTPACVAV